jgi:hypothetical protein
MRNKKGIEVGLEKVDSQLNILSSILRQGGENVVYLYTDNNN